MPSPRLQFTFVNAYGINADYGSSLSTQEIKTCAAFFARVGKVKSPNFSSYHLKHVAETFGKINGGSPYVSNGALIATAIALGYVVELSRHGGPNCAIGVSARDLAKIKRDLGNPVIA